MTHRTLGLDIGTNSIGWVLLDEQAKQIHTAGIRVFPEGVDRDQQGGEKSKNITRRTARGTRRQIARRARRKRMLQKELINAGLLPQDAQQRNNLLDLNPYTLRTKGLDESIPLYHFGRAILHLNQRRGFLSNRKTDKANDKETKGMLAEIGELEKEIRDSGARTLGEYLHNIFIDSNPHEIDPQTRIRRRHTRRDMYRHEFNTLWQAQQKHHPESLSDELKIRIDNIIFHQRDIYWPKSVIGKCDLEVKERRSPRADRVAQKFRIFQEVNNLRLFDNQTRIERKLKEEERATLIEYLAVAKDRTFEQIRKKLKLPENVRFNLERGQRDKLDGNKTDALLAAKKALGKEYLKLPEEKKDTLVRILLEEEHEDQAMSRLCGEIGLSPEQAQRALAVHLPEGHGQFSLKAMNRILPYLEKGFHLMADDESNSALHAAGYLRPDQRAIRQRDFLPPSPELTNPIVRQALVEVRRVVNSIIREYGKPASIHIELAREAKRSFEERKRILFENAERRRLREQAAERIREEGLLPSRANIQKYLLWEEQQRQCIYSGSSISFRQLLSDEVNIDHILPRWRSLDDSMANKVVCFRSENDEKKDRTPREWLEDDNPDKYQLILHKAHKLPPNKLRKFYQKEIELDDFVQRQLRDTAYISRCVSQYLKCLGVGILTPRGQMTADLRHFWGLNTILDPNGSGEKNRADHRHHAIDAICIALTNHQRLHQLANDRGKEVKEPWSNFREDVVRAVEKINVSHRVQNGLSGALHEATFYGTTQKCHSESAPDQRPWAKNWIETPNAYVRRKPIEQLNNTKHLEKVRDDAIRKILKDHLRSRNVDPDKPGKIPSDAFQGDNIPRMPSGMPIKRIRMIEESETFRPVSKKRHYQYVKPGNNHHIVYWEKGNGDKIKWTAEVTPMWDAAIRARTGQAIIDRSENKDGQFVMALSIGESFLIDGPDGQRLLCVVRKLDQRSKRVFYKLHTDARKAGELDKENLYLPPEKLRLLNACKVTVSPLGCIRRAK